MSSFSQIISSSSISYLSDSRPIKNVLVVVISSNKGLCGAFNSNVIKKALALKKNEKFLNANFSYIAVGKKANDIISKSENVVENHSSIFENLTYEESSKISDKIIYEFSSGSVDHVEIIFNSFKNAANQIVKTEQYLPIVSPEESEPLSDYIFEPSMEQIVSELVPKSLKIQLFKSIRDSFAGEHGARMTAMHKATDNATELRDDLVLTYNKARQAAITNEILEIVSGAEALKG
tara:strand:- start:575 stop:1279 length:705 start_codon:yes stop_codon:yes gene_type:complete